METETTPKIERHYMNELINITLNENHEPVVSARDLHKGLEISKRFSAWFDQNSKLFIENEEFTSVPKGTPVIGGNGNIQYLDDFALTIDMAKQLAMMSRTDKGKEVRKYFIQVEKDFNSPEKIMARALLMADKKVHTLQAQIEADKPKVIFADAVSASHTSILVGDLAKLISQNGYKIGANRLFSWLRENGYLINRKSSSWNMPTQKSMELKLFEIKETNIQHADGHISINKTPKVTGKGQQYFINKFLGQKRLA
ncbi:phage antirepressor protein [Streptococcus parauberis KCTC 11537]|nr:phage antirepressor protein [Streptococcus parauberis KCTC 11537]